MEKIYIEHEYDVIVCGSGPAGLGAAMSAKICGADVLLLESSNLPGGVICAIPWMSINRLLTDGKKRSKAHDALVRHIFKYGKVAAYPYITDIKDGHSICPHVEYAELAIYDMLEEAGIDYKMFSPVVDVVKENNIVIGVVVHEKRGNVYYKGKVVIDATGDGDVAAAAGCEYMEKSEDNGLHMPITLGFSLGGVDKEKFFAWFNARKTDMTIPNKGNSLGDNTDKSHLRSSFSEDFNEVIFEAEKNKDLYIAAWYCFLEGSLPGIVGVLHGAWKGQSLESSGINSADMTAARRNGLKVAVDLIRILKEFNVPGMENCFLDKVTTNMGVRDTRRIVGEYVLKFEDTQSDNAFEDTIARKYGFIDANQVFMGTMFQGFSYPYRSLVPKDVDGLLLAGRCGSATFIAHAAGKSMGNMMELGVAAGAAAALSIKTGVQPRNVDITVLRSTLKNELEVDL